MDFSRSEKERTKPRQSSELAGRASGAENLFYQFVKCSMNLSPLQKYILVRCTEKNSKIDRKVFCAFYANREKKPKDKYLQNVITNSLESLIDREYLVGYGKRTPHKWFMTHVELTMRGLRAAEDVLRERQNKLPLH